MKLTIELNDNIFNELYLISNELNSNESEIIEKALERYFDSLDEIIADKRLDDLNNGKEKLIDAEDVWKELGI
jgi:predicted DNA-binding protein